MSEVFPTMRRAGFAWPRFMTLVGIALLCLGAAFTALGAEPCTPALARIVSVQGKVEILRPGADWTAATLNVALCAGDRVRVQQHGRAALVLSNRTTLRLDQRTVLAFTPTQAGRPTMMEQISGGLHVITRTPRTFNIKTPFVNASVEGTEFSVRVAETSATVAVYEGIVLASNEAGTSRLVTGEMVIAGRDDIPRKELVVRSLDAVAWRLHFPFVFDPGRDVARQAPASAIGRATALYRAGQIADALAALERVPEGPDRLAALTYRAGLLLWVGRVDEARPVIAQALSQGAESDAQALQSIVATVEGESDRAIELARRAVELDARSPSAQIALSYAQQGVFAMDAALASATEAVRLDEASALAHARRAELELSVGRLAAAVTSARTAVDLNPSLAKAHVILGFAHLANTETRAARAAFATAIELDSSDPMAWLGQGLARIRQGDLAGGREDIEVGAVLDTERSLIRSYLGKAYFEERRHEEASTQFGLARQYDHRDPTPWFYGALLAHALNRPVDALLALNQSTALNDNRAVYRSRFLLDDDRAARTASTAAIHSALGFEKLAILESARAALESSDNDAAHRQLALAYANLPRHDIARVSESLQARLRQPLTATPFDPSITTADLLILEGTGPSRAGANEFNSLFSRDQWLVQGNAVAGSRGTRGEQLIVSGLSGSLGLAASDLRYRTDGFGVFDASEKTAQDVFIQFALSARSSLQVEVARSEFRLGTAYFDFDPRLAFPVTARDRSESLRIGGYFAHDPRSSWIFSVFKARGERLVEATIEGFQLTASDTRDEALELQHTRRFGNTEWVAGAGHINHDAAFASDIQVRTRATTAYLYSNTRAAPGLALHVGVSRDWFRLNNTAFGDQRQQRMQPKLGLWWSPNERTSLRIATFASLKRPLVGSQTLEPTQINGFNQFYTGYDALYGDIDGTRARRTAMAVNYRISATTFLGGEVSRRALRVPDFSWGQADWAERAAHLYGYQLWKPAGNSPLQIAATVDVEFERLIRPQFLTGAEGIVDVRTVRAPLGLRIFGIGPKAASAFFLSTARVSQRGVFAVDVNSEPIKRSRRAWVTDVSLTQKLGWRRGEISIGARNLFDRPADLFETDPLNPRTAQRRIFFAKARLVLDI